MLCSNIETADTIPNTKQGKDLVSGLVSFSVTLLF